MKNYTLYVTDMSPNGTRDLLIVDLNHEITEVIPEAVFGHNSKTNNVMPNAYAYCDHIYNIPKTGLDIDTYGSNLLWRCDIKDILSHIAVNPISDGFDTINKLYKYAKVSNR